jgi:hypothetical protein
MGAKHRCYRIGAHQDRDPGNRLTPASIGVSRQALLAGASLLMLTVFGAPSAQAACSGADQTISTIVSGPILSTGGSITVRASGAINGHPTGVQASSCSVSTLRNGGTISGAVGAAAPLAASAASVAQAC